MVYQRLVGVKFLLHCSSCKVEMQRYISGCSFVLGTKFSVLIFLLHYADALAIVCISTPILLSSIKENHFRLQQIISHAVPSTQNMFHSFFLWITKNEGHCTPAGIFFHTTNDYYEFCYYTEPYIEGIFV